MNWKAPLGTPKKTAVATSSRPIVLMTPIFLEYQRLVYEFDVDRDFKDPDITSNGLFTCGGNDILDIHAN